MRVQRPLEPRTPNSRTAVRPWRDLRHPQTGEVPDWPTWSVRGRGTVICPPSGQRSEEATCALAATRIGYSLRKRPAPGSSPQLPGAVRLQNSVLLRHTPELSKDHHYIRSGGLLVCSWLWGRVSLPDPVAPLEPIRERRNASGLW